MLRSGDLSRRIVIGGSDANPQILAALNGGKPDSLRVVTLPNARLVRQPFARVNYRSKAQIEKFWGPDFEEIALAHTDAKDALVSAIVVSPLTTKVFDAWHMTGRGWKTREEVYVRDGFDIGTSALAYFVNGEGLDTVESFDPEKLSLRHATADQIAAAATDVRRDILTDAFKERFGQKPEQASLIGALNSTIRSINSLAAAQHLLNILVEDNIFTGMPTGNMILTYVTGAAAALNVDGPSTAMRRTQDNFGDNMLAIRDQATRRDFRTLNAHRAEVVEVLSGVTGIPRSELAFLTEPEINSSFIYQDRGDFVLTPERRYMFVEHGFNLD